MSADKSVAQPPVQPPGTDTPASSGCGFGADSALAEMIRKRTVHIVEPEQLHNAPTEPSRPGGKP